MHPLLRPRRIASALLLAALVGGGLVGLAVATDDTPAPATSFLFAAPMQGDRGMYETVPHDARTAGTQERQETRFSFEHRGRTAMVDEQGTPRVVDQLAYDDASREPADFWGAPGRTAIIVDAFTSRPVAFVDEWDQQDEDDSDEVGLARTVTFDPDGRHADRLPCGLHSTLQGKEWAAGDRVGAFGCRGHPRWGDDRYTFEVDAVGADGAASLVSMWLERGGGAWKVAELVFNKDIPYPVTIESVSGGGVHVRVELTAFDRGDDPLAAPALPTPVQLTWAPRTPWMFDETGIEHPFPLSEAVKYAASDPTQDLGAWLAAHPDAYIVDASYWDYERSTGDAIEWRIAFRERQEMYHLHIGKREVVPDDHPADPVLDLLGLGGSPSQTYYFQAATRHVEEYGTWWPAPDSLPTVASLWAFYDTWASPALREAGPNMYEIWIDGGDDGNRVLVSAGRFRDYPEGRDDPTITYSRDWAFVEVEAGRDDHPFRFSDRGNDKPLQHPGPASPMDAGALAPVRVAAFLPLDLREAAGVGAAALGAALVYYLWPVLKGGAVGLFSRVRHDQVLEHPTRRRIHDYITAHPGCHYRGMLAALPLGKGTLQHHLGKLERAGLVTSALSGGYRCFFIPGAQHREAMHAHGLLKSAVARGILEACRRQPGITTGQLAGHLGVTAPTVSYHLRRLREVGLVESLGRGHATAA